MSETEVETDVERPDFASMKQVSHSDRFIARPLDASKKLWLRQKGEGHKAYEAFMTYLMLDPDKQTHAETARVLGKSTQLMQNWSRQWSWRERLASHQEFYLLMRLDSIEADRDRMWARQKELAETVIGVVELRFMQLVTEFGEEGKGTSSVKADALTRMLDIGTKLQRMSVLGRVASAQEVAERNERLGEAYADELSEFVNDLLNETNLSPEQEAKFKETVERYLATTPS